MFLVLSRATGVGVSQAIEKDLNAALGQQRAASFARSRSRSRSSSNNGSNSRISSVSTGGRGSIGSSREAGGAQGGSGDSGDSGGGEVDDEEEEAVVGSKVASLVLELSAARRAHDATEARLQREVEALRAQVKGTG
jgi:hypothetical protein